MLTLSYTVIFGAVSHWVQSGIHGLTAAGFFMSLMSSVWKTEIVFTNYLILNTKLHKNIKTIKSFLLRAIHEAAESNVY